MNEHGEWIKKTCCTCRQLNIKLPRSVLPYETWQEENPEPTITDLLARNVEVNETIDRWRAAGLTPDPHWLREIGTMPILRLHIGTPAMTTVVTVEPEALP